MQKESPFWLVWNVNGHAPTVKHTDIRTASAEAERLARRNTGQRFIVLESVMAVEVDNITRIDMRPEDEIPF